MNYADLTLEAFDEACVKLASPKLFSSDNPPVVLVNHEMSQLML